MFANVLVLTCDVDEPTGLRKRSVHKTCCHCEEARRGNFPLFSILSEGDPGERQ